MSVDNLERWPVYPPESWGWQTMERFFLDTARLAGYLELRCPAGKEAPADVREIFAAQSGPAKYSLLLPCRKIGAAVLGTSSLTAAAELMALAGDFLGGMGAAGAKLNISGSPEALAALRVRLDRLDLAYDTETGEGLSFSLETGSETLGRGGSLDGGFWIELEPAAVLRFLREQGVELPQPDAPVLYLSPAGDEWEPDALAIAEDLRTDGFSVLADWSGAGPAEGLSRAEAAGARFYAVVDAASVSEGKLAVRSLEDGRTSRVELGDGLTRFFYDQELSELSGVLEGFPFQDGAEE